MKMDIQEILSKEHIKGPEMWQTQCNAFTIKSQMGAHCKFGSAGLTREMETPSRAVAMETRQLCFHTSSKRRFG